MKLLNFYLSRYPLYISGTRDVRFEIPEDSERKAIFRYKVTLPAYVTCTQCVIQWNYYTGSYYITIVYVNFGRMCSLHIYISIMETKYKRNNYRNSNIQTRFTLTLRILRSGVHIFSNNFSMLFITTYDVYDLLSGNMWGTCENGTEANGCGRPETFRNCADVSIITSTAGVPPLFVQQDNPFLLYYKDYRSPNNIFPLVVR